MWAYIWNPDRKFALWYHTWKHCSQVRSKNFEDKRIESLNIGENLGSQSGFERVSDVWWVRCGWCLDSNWESEFGWRVRVKISKKENLKKLIEKKLKQKVIIQGSRRGTIRAWWDEKILEVSQILTSEDTELLKTWLGKHENMKFKTLIQSLPAKPTPTQTSTLNATTLHTHSHTNEKRSR